MHPNCTKKVTGCQLVYKQLTLDLTEEEFEVATEAVRAYRAEKEQAERAAEIGHNIQKEILDLEELGFNVYYGGVHIIDVENLRVVKN